MKETTIIALASLAVTATSLILNFVQNREKNKLKKMKSKYRSNVKSYQKALLAIQGYQAIEERMATEQGQHIQDYRTRARDGLREDYFVDADFIAPASIERRKSKLEEELSEA